MVKNLFWVLVLGGLVYGGYTIVDGLINGTGISERKGMMQHTLEGDGPSGKPPSAIDPDPPPPDYGDDAGMFD